VGDRADEFPIAIAIAGLLVAVVAALFLEPAAVTPPVSGPQSAVDPHAVHDFLAAWRRSKTVTYAAEQTFRREFDDGRAFASESTIVQRPPDRLVSGMGIVEGQLGGHAVRCATGGDGKPACFTGADPFDYAGELDEEIAALRSYLLGGPPLYAIAAAPGGCFELTQARDYPLPPYGSFARFCFDPSTGAAVRIEIHRPGSVDTTVTGTIRTEVTDADFVLPAPA